MANEKKNVVDGFDEANAAALTEMLMDPTTSESVRLQIINELNEASKTATFFEAMFNEELSLGMCPCCHHKNHWLIPEDIKAQFGWVSAEKDQRVKRHTDAKDCPTYQECCSKKMVTS